MINELTMKFGMEVCTQAGVVSGHPFNRGEIYPVLGNNNGMQICFVDDKGDTQILLCHSYRDPYGEDTEERPVWIQEEEIDPYGEKTPVFVRVRIR